MAIAISADSFAKIAAAGGPIVKGMDFQSPPRSDALAVPVLIGLGVTELSVSVPAIPAIKAQVKRLSLLECQQLAREVLLLDSAQDVRARLAEFAEQSI